MSAIACIARRFKQFERERTKRLFVSRSVFAVTLNRLSERKNTYSLTIYFVTRTEKRESIVRKKSSVCSLHGWHGLQSAWFAFWVTSMQAKVKPGRDVSH